MERRTKGRYFSVRFSADTLERIERARLGIYGSRCTLAEAIRRLVEDRLEQLGPPPRVQDTRPPEWLAAEANKHAAVPERRVTGRAESSFAAEDAEYSSRTEQLRRVAAALRVTSAEISQAAVDLKAIVEGELILLADAAPEISPMPASNSSADVSDGPPR